ncbi:MAG: hypothetical protein ACR5KV_04290 [Wolbachia sp.]
MRAIYEGFNSMFSHISDDRDKNKGSLSSEKINIHYQNLKSILKIVDIIKGLKTGSDQVFVILSFDESELIRDVESLQKNMKKEVEKRQQQQNKARQKN